MALRVSAATVASHAPSLRLDAIESHGGSHWTAVIPTLARAHCRARSRRPADIAFSRYEDSDASDVEDEEDVSEEDEEAEPAEGMAAFTGLNSLLLTHHLQLLRPPRSARPPLRLRRLRKPPQQK